MQRGEEHLESRVKVSKAEAAAAERDATEQVGERERAAERQCAEELRSVWPLRLENTCETRIWKRPIEFSLALDCKVVSFAGRARDDVVDGAEERGNDLSTVSRERERERFEREEIREIRERERAWARTERGNCSGQGRGQRERERARALYSTPAVVWNERRVCDGAETFLKLARQNASHELVAADRGDAHLRVAPQPHSPDDRPKGHGGHT